jgi:DNA-binding MarR family transcriptional regulator
MANDPEVCSCAALRQATRHVTRLYDAALAPVGLSLNQYAILARLKRHGPMRLKDLADNLVTDRSTLGHLVRPLERRGLVALVVGHDDRRSRRLQLTAAGVELAARAYDLWAGVEAGFAEAFGVAEAAALRRTLKRVESVELGRQVV